MYTVQDVYDQFIKWEEEKSGPAINWIDLRLQNLLWNIAEKELYFWQLSEKEAKFWNEGKEEK